MMNQTPILIVGGFASEPKLYRPLRAYLAEVSGRQVFIAPITLVDWAWVTITDSYAGLLRKLDRTVNELLAQTGSSRLTLVAHSAGGVLARIFLGDQPYNGQAYYGYQRIDMLVMLGTPQRAEREGRIGGLNQIRWADQRYPGAYWSEVSYVSVIGRSIFGDPDGPPPERGAHQSYRLISGEGAQWGDGVVPLDYGLLPGSLQIVIPGLRHDPRPDRLWYGSSPATVAVWWHAAAAYAATKADVISYNQTEKKMTLAIR
ncbi:esterase/lipase family protein [Chloroflexus sp.]|uniref:esterase/lipase family protein n=1 Tax=Chloroflexus sp. TaxID=1904827 RepID=UPI0026181245|nr:lipase [uncultured Chloroflexus sp.]